MEYCFVKKWAEDELAQIHSFRILSTHYPLPLDQTGFTADTPLLSRIHRPAHCFQHQDTWGQSCQHRKEVTRTKAKAPKP